jgi:hypothetical protein
MRTIEIFRIAAIGVILSAPLILAGEGMWTFDNSPLKLLKDK